MKKTNIKPSAYLKTVPKEVRKDMVTMDREIHEIMNEPRSVWSGVFWGGTKQTIIGYGDYNYARPKGKTVEWFKIGLALQKNYISVYVNAVEGKQYLAERYAKKLGAVKVGKSSVSFKSLDELDLVQFRRMITEAKKLMA